MLYLLLLVLLICTALAVVFHLKNKALKQQAMSLQLNLIEETLTHKNQIASRNSNLDKYHFLRYNLNEALAIQPEINI